MRRREFPLAGLAAAAVPALGQSDQKAYDIGSRRELFVDQALLASLQGAELRAATPLDAGTALQFDRPWEGAFSAYSTIVAADGRFRLYYRGVPRSGKDGNETEVTCCAESADGVHWTRPELRLFSLPDASVNNVILAGQPPFSHNFSPFLDTRPGVPEGQRFKALAGIHQSGLHAFVSADGLRWSRLGDQPVVPSPKEFSFDSQNVSFWSRHEGRYVLYFRTWKKVGGVNYRWISRASSDDFLHWRTEGEIDYAGAPPEHLYTNQTSAYFRAPHFYTAICARFMPNLVFPLYSLLWGWKAGAVHAAFGATVAWVLMEALMLNLDKVPFTCSYVPGKVNLKASWPLFVIAYIAYVSVIIALETAVLRVPESIFAVFLTAAAAKLAMERWRRNRAGEFVLVYDERPEPVVRTLGLTG